MANTYSDDSSGTVTPVTNNPVVTAWRPNFALENPYEGVPEDYIVQIRGTQAYNDALGKGWFTDSINITPKAPVENTPTYLAPLSDGSTSPPKTVALTTVWKPDFTKPSPYERMPPEYITAVNESFVPTEANPLSPVEIAMRQGQISGITPVGSSDVDKLLPTYGKVEEGYTLTPQSQKMVDAMNNVALKPYLSVTGDGKLSVDIGKAAAAGVNINLLSDLGYSQQEIDSNKNDYVKYTADKKQYDNELVKFETDLKSQPLELQNAYNKGGIDAYNRALTQYNNTQQLVFKAQLATMPQELQIAYKTGGYDNYLKAVDVYNTKVEKQQHMYDLSMNILDSYKDKNGIYDITKYLKDVKGTKGSDLVLKSAGFSDEDIKLAQYQANLNYGQQMWQGMTPWDEARGQKVSVAGASIMAAELVVPGVYTARHWNDMSVGEKSLAIAIDAVSIIPFISAAGRGARVVSVTGEAVRGARFVGALKGIGAEMAAQVTAPVNIIIHPIGTAKTTFREVSGLIENIASKNRLPEAAVTNLYHTAKLRVVDTTTKAEAMVMRDEVVRMAGQSQSKSVFVQLGDNVVELRPSKLMKELGGGMASGTAFGEQLNKKIVTVGENDLAKGGMYFSPTPAPRFSAAASTGAMGKEHTLIIASPETAKKMVSSNKTYRGTVELEAILPEGEQIKIAQKLYTRIGPTGQYTEILLEKPLSLRQIAKLKLEGLAETIKQPFQPVIKTKGTAFAGTLGEEETQELSRVLRASGNTRQATSVVRAYKLITTDVPRASTPTISGKRGRVSATELERAKVSVRKEIGYVTPETGRAIKIDEAPRVSTVKEADRVNIKEPERRGIAPEEERTPPRRVEETPPRTLPREPDIKPPREPGRVESPEPGRTPPRIEEPIPARNPPRVTEPLPPRNPPRKPEENPPRPPRINPPELKAPRARIYPQSGESSGEERPKIPQGSIAWKQGFFWKFIPPPWNQKKPLTLRKAPDGARYLNARSPKESIQMIGKSDALVPKSASIDLGVVDILVSDYGRVIAFKGKGLETSVGQSGSRTTGMSINSGGSAKTKFHKPTRNSKRTNPEMKRL